MRYIKLYEAFDDRFSKAWEPFKEKFGISREEIEDLLIDIGDEFNDIYYHVGWLSPNDSNKSWLVEPNEDIFVIYFESSKPVWEAENLYDLENYLYKGKLNQIKSYLKDYDLEVYATDFGESDTQYEIVVCKKGSIVVKGDAYFKRYSGH